MYRAIHKDLRDLKYLYLLNNLRITEFQTLVSKDKCQAVIPNAHRYKLKSYKIQVFCILGVAILFNSRIQRQLATERRTIAFPGN
jgi:hypothetical protein